MNFFEAIAGRSRDRRVGDAAVAEVNELNSFLVRYQRINFFSCIVIRNN